jgi:HSP20 family protein
MSKGKEKSNGFDQKGTAVEERPSGRSDGQRKAPAYQSTFELASQADAPSPIERRFAEELDRFFEGFRMGSDLLPRWPFALSRRLGAGRTDVSPEAWAPAVEVFQRGDRLIIRADLPGLSKEDLHVEVADDTVTIRGERRQEHEERRDNYFHSERSYGSFFRKILLPDGVQAEKAEASFRDRVLEITMPAPRRAESQQRRLEVKVD